MDWLAQRVARGARHGRDDGPLLARETIEQARFADVGAPRQDGVHAAAQQAPLPAPREHFFERAAHARQALRRSFAMQRVEFLLRKIELCFGERAQLDQRSAQRFHRR